MIKKISLSLSLLCLGFTNMSCNNNPITSSKIDFKDAKGYKLINKKDTVVHGEDYVVTIAYDEGYEFESIDIKIGKSSLQENKDYKFRDENKTELIIFKDSINGDVTINLSTKLKTKPDGGSTPDDKSTSYDWINKSSNYNDFYKQLPTNIDLNDTPDDVIREYYSYLNTLDEKERQGTNLLKNLKPILKHNQKYFSYDISGQTIWQVYEIVNRDWTLSPANDIKYGQYDQQTNKITGYVYGTNKDHKDKNPYLHALYFNRDNEKKPTAWDDHQQTQWGINREHIWAKSLGMHEESKGGARGDPMHLMPGNGYVNGSLHSNYFYGYVDKSKNYIDQSTQGKNFTNLNNNLCGKSLTLPNSTAQVFEPQDCDKGDIARAIFYMVARYNFYSQEDIDGIGSFNPNLEIVQDIADAQASNNNSYTSSEKISGKMAILSDLLAWHHADPVDEFEIHRNNLLFTNYTHNRNPFIDFPQWVDYIWGSVKYDQTKYISYDSQPIGFAKPTSDQIYKYN